MDAQGLMAPKTLRFHLLGGFHLEAGEEASPAIVQPRLQFLLAYLLLHCNVHISRHQLAFALWPDSTEEQAHANLRNLLHRLRAVLSRSAYLLHFDRHSVWLEGDDALWLDVAAFSSDLVMAATAERAGDPLAACQALEDAMAIYVGDLLPACYDDWIAVERERLHQAHLHALDHLILLLEKLRAYEKAIYYAEMLVRQDPLHEPACQYLMRLYLAAGSRADALRAYHACATQGLTVHQIFPFVRLAVTLAFGDLTGEDDTFDVEDGQTVSIHLVFGVQGPHIPAGTDQLPHLLQFGAIHAGSHA